MIFHIGAIQRTERFPQWIGQFARVPQVLLSQVTRPPTHPAHNTKSNQIVFAFLSFTLRLRAPSYFVNTETPEVIWQAAEKNSIFLYPGSHVALSVKEARIHNIHCRPIESGRNDLLQDRDGDRGEGVRDQVRHRPCLLPGWEWVLL